MDSLSKDFYNLGGLNRDVNPILNKDSDLLDCINFYTRRIGSKKVRFGYAAFLDKIDSSPVRNLIYFNLPAEKGVFRYSNKKLYKYSFSGGTWGAAVETLTSDVVLGSAILAGSVPYVHLSNATDGYLTYDHSGGFKNWAGSYTPKASFLAAWQSRIFADVNKLSLAESAISFDLNTGYTADPFTINNNDPAGGGTVSIDAGNNGQIVGITASIDRIQIYKSLGIYRYNGTSFLKLPYFGNILGVCSTKNNVDYILATNGIWRNDGQSITQADFGVRTILQDTINTYGIVNPVLFSFGDLTFFYIGNIKVGSGDAGYTVTNGCLVHDEVYDEWFVWSLGHNMTAFGYYIDPTTNQPNMISGDDQGNTYIWGEQYSSDAGKPIAYRLRGPYHTFQSPSRSKIAEKYTISSDQADNITLEIAKDYSEQYVEEETFKEGMLRKGYMSHIYQFKVISFQFIGATTTNRPEIYGYTIGWKDVEERNEGAKSRASKGRT